jgi:hypothetical protein
MGAGQEPLSTSYAEVSSTWVTRDRSSAIRMASTISAVIRSEIARSAVTSGIWSFCQPRVQADLVGLDQSVVADRHTAARRLSRERVGSRSRQLDRW